VFRCRCAWRTLEVARNLTRKGKSGLEPVVSDRRAAMVNEHERDAVVMHNDDGGHSRQCDPRKDMLLHRFYQLFRIRGSPNDKHQRF